MAAHGQIILELMLQRSCFAILSPTPSPAGPEAQKGLGEAQKPTKAQKKKRREDFPEKRPRSPEKVGKRPRRP